MTTHLFEEKMLRCRTAQAQWYALSAWKRLAPVRAFRHGLVAAADELMAAVEADVGRPPAEIIGSDVLPLADAAKFLETNAASILAPRKVGRAPISLVGQRDVIHRRPHGVVGIIGTWNYPLLLNGVQILQAVVAGNGVLWKPSEYGARSAAVLVKLMHDAGFPCDLIQELPTDREAGAQLIEAQVDHVVFTGSVSVGRKIAKRLGERLIPSTMELSGCDAMFVLADADVELAAKAAWFGISMNRGQTCLAIRRIFVAKSIANAFTTDLRRHLDSTTPMRLVTSGQVRQLEELAQDAIAKGGDILKPADCDRREWDECAVAPQIIVKATPEMAICQVDLFGPMAAMMTFDRIEQALEMESRCPFALGASIFSQNIDAAQHLASRLRASMVSINDCLAPTTHPGTPFGGRGQSGWGETQGTEGLLAMTVPQTVSTRRGKFRPHFDGATPELEGLVRGILNWKHGPRFAARMSGMWQTLRGLLAVRRKV